MPTLASTFTDRRCLAVVPAYNEADTVAAVIEALRRDAPHFDVVVVNDGSTDATAPRAEQAGAEVLRLAFNPAFMRLVTLCSMC
jgi:glycosyltransferase involved in cell wall biosynthesis